LTTLTFCSVSSVCFTSSFQCGKEIELVFGVTEELIARIPFADQRFDRRFGILLRQIAIEHEVFRLRAARDADDQITSVVGDAAAEHPFRLILAFVDQQIVGLLGAEPVEIQFLEFVGGLERVALRFVVTTVEKTGSVAAPARAGEFHPLEHVVGVLRGVDVEYAPLFPIRAAGGKSVGQIFSVITDRITLKRDGAVAGKFVRIEQHARCDIERFGHVQNGLIL
jgi:hypothetical protein